MQRVVEEELREWQPLWERSDDRAGYRVADFYRTRKAYIRSHTSSLFAPLVTVNAGMQLSLAAAPMPRRSDAPSCIRVTIADRRHAPRIGTVATCH